MTPAARLLLELGRRGRPSAPRSLLVSTFRWSGAAILLLPAAAVLWRLRFGPLDRDNADRLAWFLLLLLLPVLAALPALLRRRGDPVATASRLDARTGGGERLLSAADAARRGSASRLLPLAASRALDLIAALPPSVVARAPWPRPRPLRWLTALVLAALVLLVPAADSGLLGSPDPDSSSAAVRPGAEGGRGDADRLGAPDADLFGAKIVVDGRTDARLYALGQEIEYTLSLETLEPMPAGLGVLVTLIVDEGLRLPLGIDWTLPVETGGVLETTIPLKEALEAVGKYERGLLTLRAELEPRVPREDLKGVAETAPLTIQISENQEDVRARRKAPTRPQPKPQQRKRSPENPEPKPDRPPERPPQARRPEPTGPGPAPAPPEDIAAVERVIEPLFSGDERTRREVRTFERELETSDRRPPAPDRPAVSDRGYRKLEEVPILKAPIPPGERELVRRYLERIRPGRGPGER